MAPKKSEWSESGTGAGQLDPFHPDQQNQQGQEPSNEAANPNPSGPSLEERVAKLERMAKRHGLVDHEDIG